MFLFTFHSPFVYSFSPEHSRVLVELGPQLAVQLVTDVTASHAVAGGNARGEDDEDHGEHGVAPQDLLLNSQQLLRLAEVTCGRKSSTSIIPLVL